MVGWHDEERWVEICCIIGVPNGEGTLYYDSGDVHLGKFLRGKPDGVEKKTSLLQNTVHPMDKTEGTKWYRQIYRLE